MARVKKGKKALKSRKKVLKSAKGYRFGRSTKKKEANKNRKKVEVKGGRFVANILPAIKVLPRNTAAENNLM